jgi:triphosphatase
MVEVELKFQVPERARAAVQRAVVTPLAQTTRLRARYFDTTDRRLAAAGIALRLRLEGRLWVQTVKVGQHGVSRRLEHEVALPPGTVDLDLHRHDTSPAGSALREALGTDGAPLAQLFETDVRRCHRVLRSGSARVELALDIGTLRAAGRREPIWELEFELLKGSLQDLVGVAGRWVQRHGLWLDLRSKAERGLLLALGMPVSPATGYRPPPLQPDDVPDRALRAMMASTLSQALPNASALAGGVGQPEHLHQLRVGLRRLRSVLRLFGHLHPGDELATLDEPLAGLFRQLSGARDRDALGAAVWPALAAAGGPAVPESVSPDGLADPAVASLLREPDTVSLLLDLLAHAEGHAEDGAHERPPAGPASVRTVAARCLGRLHRRLRSMAAGFDQLEVEQQHRLRRQIKRLRYGVEATQSLWPAKAVRRYLGGLRPLQEALGTYNDLIVAQAVLPFTGEADAAFARGWLAARRAQAFDAAVAALQLWPAAPRAWRKHSTGD